MTQQSDMTLPFASVGAHTSDGSLATAKTLTAPAGGTLLLIQAITQNIRVTLDGTTPTSTVGFRIKAGDPAVVVPARGNTIKIIEELASATAQYQWGRI